MSLNFNSTEMGGIVVVFIGNAEHGNVAPTPEEIDAYYAKYLDAIRSMNYSRESFFQDYSVPIRVTPDKLRGT